MQPIEFELNADDVLAANRLAVRVAYRRRRQLIPLGVLWLLYAMIGYWVADGEPLMRLAIAIGLSLVFTIVIAALIVVINHLLLPRRSRRNFAQQRSLHGPMRLSWDDQMLHLSGERGSTDYRWADFVKWAQGPDGLIVYQSDNLYNLLPRRILDAAAIEDIRAHLAAHAVPKVG